jgi:ribonuclease BN (tRNA processing enzyme)
MDKVQANRLVLLGTKGGASVRKGSPRPSSSALQIDGKTYVIDCGLGVTRALVDADISLSQMDGVFITHLHCDHLLELGPLIYTAWLSGLNRPLNIFGPTGITEYWNSFLAAMSFDHGVRTQNDKRGSLKDLISITTYGEGSVASLGDLTVSALRVEHPPVDECYALKFETPKLKIVFSADTKYFSPLAQFAYGADILIHEAMLDAGIDALVQRIGANPDLRQHLEARHTMAPDVGKIATAASVKHLVLNHLVPADDPEFTDAHWHKALSQTWDGPLSVGKDGMVIDLPHS